MSFDGKKVHDLPRRCTKRCDRIRTCKFMLIRTRHACSHAISRKLYERFSLGHACMLPSNPQFNCFENKGVMSVSYTLESMILSNLRLLFGSAVKWSYAPAPAFLSRSSPVVWLSQLYWQLQCWNPVPALIVNHRAVVVPTPHAGNTCIVLSFEVDFDLHLRSIVYVPITKKFTENIFADSCKVAKFVKIFFLEKTPLYGSFMVANQLFMQPFPTHNTQT